MHVIFKNSKNSSIHQSDFREVPLFASVSSFEILNNTTCLMDSCEDSMWVFKHQEHSKPSIILSSYCYYNLFMLKKTSNMYLSIWKEALRFSFSFTIYCKRQHSPISKLKKTSLCIYLIITNKFHPNILLYFLEYKTHPPNLGGKWGCIL